MRKLVVLFCILLGLGLFVYFYEIQGKEKREEARKLEESLLALKEADITGVEILKPEAKEVRLVREGKHWALESPIQSAADQSSVDGLLRDLEEAKRERTLKEPGKDLAPFGLDSPKLTLKVRAGKKAKTVRIGKKDFSGDKVYVRLDEGPEVLLTSSLLLTAADHDVKHWRSKKILAFERDKVRQIEILNGSSKIDLKKEGEEWQLEAPLKEKADQGTVSGLLSSLEFGEVKDFVAEKAADLAPYGLKKSRLSVRVRQEGEDRWVALELGKKRKENYLARNPSRPLVFTVTKEIHDKLTQDLWKFRDKDVVDVNQDDIERIRIRRGSEEIVLRHEDFKWMVEKPEEKKEKEALTYKFWYPIDDMKFESIESGKKAFPKADVEIVVELKKGGKRTFQVAKQGDRYLARKVESGRTGTISAENYKKLQFKLEDILSK